MIKLNTPKVSVIIPVYNAENFLRECLDSVAAQSLMEIEIICVDDGSTDSSLSILQSYQKKDKRFIIKRQKNSGSGKARNNGLTLANGEFVVFMDGDDYYPDKNVLEEMYCKAVAHRAKICGGGLSVNRNGVTKSGIENGETYYFTNEGMVDYASVQYDYGYQRYMFSRALLKEHDIVFPDYLRFQDPPFLARAMTAAGKFYALRIDTYCYRWGHQRVNWDYQRVNDLVRGIRDNLQLSRECGFKLLHRKCMQRLNREYFPTIENSLVDGNPQLPLLLYETSGFVCREWVDEDDGEVRALISFLKAVQNTPQENLTNAAVQRENAVLRAEIQNIRASWSYRIGYFITFIPRKIRGSIRCYREHGLEYTWQRILVHLGVKEGPCR